MNKKKSILALAASFMFLKVIPLVSAAWNSYDISQGPRDLIRVVSDFLSPFFEALLNTSAFDEFFFAKILLLILLFVIIVFVLNKAKIFGDLESKPGVIYIIASVVSILAMRYLPETDLIKGILLPYSALGIAITSFLPLIIYFFFIHNSNFGGFGRRAGWVLYGIVFIALWISKDVQLSDTSNWIYWSALIFVLLSLIFDRSIHQYFAFSEIRKVHRTIGDEQIVEMINKYHKAVEAYNKTGNAAAKSQMMFLKKRLKEEGAKID